MRTLRILSTAMCVLAAVALLAADGQAAPRRHTTGARKGARVHAAVKHVARTAAKPNAAAPGVAGMVVAVDPTDGSLRMPNADELSALGAAMPSLNESTDGLTSVQVPGKGVMVDLQGRFQDYMVVRFGADGKPVYGCGKSVAGAMAETYGPNRAPSALEVK